MPKVHSSLEPIFPASALKRGFPRASFWGVLFLCLCIATAIAMLFKASNDDRDAYLTLMLESNSNFQDKSKKASYTASQERKQVKKELTFLSGDQRLQFEMMSQDSILRLHNRQHGTELIEEMTEVKCYMQEELYYALPNGKKTSSSTAGAVAMQIVRFCHADSAIYSYQSEQCCAKEVDIARYICPGHSLQAIKLDTLKPVMKGRAESVEFSLAGANLNFKAHQFTATLTTGG